MPRAWSFPRRRGHIINVCSVQSELGRPGIQVNGLGPGHFRTELTEALVADATFTARLASRTPAGRWGEVDELAGAVIFLASDAVSFVTGHILSVDHGITASL